MAVGGWYIAWRIRRGSLPFVRVYGQWVEEHIIPLASQLTAMADAVEQKAYDELMSQPVGEYYHGDGSQEAEQSFDTGLSFYQDITAMYQGTLNLFAAGLFHVIEQRLADLTQDGAIDFEGSDTKLDNVVAWYKRHFLLDLTQFSSWSLIDEMRLVANTTKHAEGQSAEKLRNIRPELFQNPLVRKFDPTSPIFHAPLHLPLSGDGLYVTGDEFRRYHKAAEELFDWLVQYFESKGDDHFPQ